MHKKYSNTISAGLAAKTASFKYGNNFKNVLDLYINNSCTSKKLFGSKSVQDSMSEFSLGKCAMVQNGDWAWSQISGTKGNIVKSKDVKFMPIYTGVKGEAKPIIIDADRWKLALTGFNPTDKKLAESLFSIGNGHMSLKTNFPPANLCFVRIINPGDICT